ncbi:hypothetical protein [Streptomyces noursei]|uniref:hypothetical protein n=1 Tax=Streptomyces noursei TaxID=1971 RepID=UPI00167629AD|nr:hypothetical protein [Streptomyces noursei]MCZ1019408.1 hypothetical protein [Streptomyces noursei]GGX08200.1 hypothetical protein GCM10010341_32330 [Streptomyces noursei]
MFVTVDDVEVRLGRTIEGVEKPRVEAFIGDASALVQDYCGSGFRESAGIKAVICAEVIRWLAVQPGIVSEKVGDIQVEFGTSATTQSLSPAARTSLKKYRKKLASVPLAVDQPKWDEVIVPDANPLH